MSSISSAQPPSAALNTQPTPFVPPPLDSSVHFADWIDFHLEHNHDALYSILVDNGNDENVAVTWGEMSRAAIRLAVQIREQVHVTDDQRKNGVRIAILANTDTITYCTLVFAILRAGFTVFPISTRNSVPALEHLVHKTSTSYLFGSVPQPGEPTSALQETTAELLALLPHVTLLEVPKYADLFPRLGCNPIPPYDAKSDAAQTLKLAGVKTFPEYAAVTQDSPIIILHSSGSTSFPKPIPLSHRYWRSTCKYLRQPELIGTRWSIMGLPIFHAMGVFLGIGMPASSGTIMLAFKPSSQPSLPSPEVVLQAIKRSDPEYVMTVPSVYVEWAHDDNTVEYLASRTALVYGGGPLAKETGDKLVQAGARMINGYGTTEVGLLFKLAPLATEDPEDWNYGEFWPDSNIELIPESETTYRLVVLDCEEHPVAVSNQSDRKAFDTNDLLERHPTKKNLWKPIGRADDQIMMSNGEKTNPGPMESIISGNPNVKSCMMFGRGRTQVGIAIEPADEVKITTDEELAEFRNLIWPEIEKANAFAPQLSRIFKEFILVIDPQKKPFIKTPKGTISRNATLQQFAEEIDALYDAAEQPVKAGWAEPPSAWDEVSIHAFVTRVVNGVMRGEDNDRSLIDENRDVFEQGCDSLQATYIRAALTSALRQAPKPEGKSDIAAASVPQNLVFSYPTIKRLTGYLCKAIAGAVVQHSQEEQETTVVEDMLAMVKKYTQEFPVHQPNDRSSSKEVVLLTGTTGTLGTYLLESLLLDDRVERVYAVNRKSLKHDLLDRQRDAFDDRGVDMKLLDSPKLRLVESNLDDEKLGFSADLFAEICSSLTTIIHNAWRLDFNLSLSAFESNVRSSRLLLDLAIKVHGARPAQFIFTSSIGTLAKWTQPFAVPEEPLENPVIASANGYAQGKWVTERIVLASAKERGVRTTIWRVGQLAGSVHNGAWNTTDWLPLIVKSGERLGVLPSLPGVVSWLPTDKAAQSITDAMHGSAQASNGTIEYLHLVHPRPTTWDNVFTILANGMKCSLIPYTEWVYKLEDSAEDPSEVERDPAIKLLDFYRNTAAAVAQAAERNAAAGYVSKEAMGFGDIQTAKAQERSETLKKLESLHEEDVQRWMAYWRKKGFLA